MLLQQGLDYLHEKSIVHGDLKPDNMLLASDGRVKISDFGSARLVDHGHRTVRTMGTPAFLAPEMCEGAPYHGEVADIWALGICLYMFIYGEHCRHLMECIVGVLGPLLCSHGCIPPTSEASVVSATCLRSWPACILSHTLQLRSTPASSCCSVCSCQRHSQRRERPVV